MRTCLYLLSLGFIIMAMTIAYGFISGDIWNEARILSGYVWFHVSIIDLYTGFLLFGGWIIFREHSALVAGIWIFLLLILGNLASCAYAVVALIGARGDWRVFWMGQRPGQFT